MSHIPAWRFEVLVRCTVCDRAIVVLLYEGLDLRAELQRKGACVVGPNKNGLDLVEGCVGCLRYRSTRKPLPGMGEGSK